MADAIAYVDQQGNYLGHFAPGAGPAGAIATTANPTDGSASWNGTAWVPPPSTPAQLLRAKLAAGCQIVSTGTPALNGTYPLDQESLFEITSVAAGLAEGKGFPLGASTVQFVDVAGATHAFDATSFPNWAAAIRDYLAGLKQAARGLAGGQQAGWPPQPATIP